MTYWITALSARPAAGRLTHWAWADHDGWHTTTHPPSAGPVPTGQVWAWGQEAWAYWREDHTHPSVAGCLLVRAGEPPGEDWAEACVKEFAPRSKPGGAEAAEVSAPRVRGGDGTLRNHQQVLPEGASAPSQLWGRPARVLQVLSPTHLSLFDVSL